MTDPSHCKMPKQQLHGIKVTVGELTPASDDVHRMIMRDRLAMDRLGSVLSNPLHIDRAIYTHEPVEVCLEFMYQPPTGAELTTNPQMAWNPMEFLTWDAEHGRIFQDALENRKASYLTFLLTISQDMTWRLRNLPVSDPVAFFEGTKKHDTLFKEAMAGQNKSRHVLGDPAEKYHIEEYAPESNKWVRLALTDATERVLFSLALVYYDLPQQERGKYRVRRTTRYRYDLNHLLAMPFRSRDRFEMISKQMPTADDVEAIYATLAHEHGSLKRPAPSSYENSGADVHGAKRRLTDRLHAAALNTYAADRARQVIVAEEKARAQAMTSWQRDYEMNHVQIAWIAEYIAKWSKDVPHLNYNFYMNLPAEGKNKWVRTIRRDMAKASWSQFDLLNDDQKEWAVVHIETHPDTHSIQYHYYLNLDDGLKVEWLKAMLGEWTLHHSHFMSEADRVRLESELNSFAPTPEGITARMRYAAALADLGQQQSSLTNS